MDLQATNYFRQESCLSPFFQQRFSGIYFLWPTGIARLIPRKRYSFDKPLAGQIRRTIEDWKPINLECEQILAMAESDRTIDNQERKLLTELQEMLANRSVVKVPDWISK
jgi:hypothetical protein